MSDKRHVIQCPSFRKRYTKRKWIGEGSSGIVFCATRRTTGEKHAVKIVPKKNLFTSNGKEALLREIRIVHSLEHRNIASFHKSFEDKHNVYIVTEYAADGDLLQFLQKNRRLEEREALIIFQQVLLAVDYLHARGIAHRDIKPENIVISHGVIKLIDFGLAYCRRPGTVVGNGDKFCGSAPYMAPELLYGLPHIPERAEMWACGVLLYALLTGKSLFEHTERSKLMRRVRNFCPTVLLTSRSLSHVSQSTLELLGRLLDNTPSKRPTASQCLARVHIARESLNSPSSIRRGEYGRSCAHATIQAEIHNHSGENREKRVEQKGNKIKIRTANKVLHSVPRTHATVESKWDHSMAQDRKQQIEQKKSKLKVLKDADVGKCGNVDLRSRSKVACGGRGKAKKWIRDRKSCWDWNPFSGSNRDNRPRRECKERAGHRQEQPREENWVEKVVMAFLGVFSFLMIPPQRPIRNVAS